MVPREMGVSGDAEYECVMLRLMLPWSMTDFEVDGDGGFL